MRNPRCSARTQHHVLCALAACAGTASLAAAVDNTRIDWQVSRDNVTWRTSIEAAPGETVFARAVVTYIGTAAPLGLASLVFQPTVSNWDATGLGSGADLLLPFVNDGAGSNTSTPLGVVTNTADPTQFGRISPWGRSSLSTSARIFGHVHTSGSGGAPAGTWLRIAQAHVTSWLRFSGNTTGGGGVSISQLSDQGRTTSDPAFNPSLAEIEVFKFGVVLGDQGSRSLLIDSPHPWRDAFGNPLEIYWWGAMTENTGSIRGTPIINTATVVVPAPWGIAAVLLGPLCACRRRIQPP